MRALAETENVRNRMSKQLGDMKLYAIQGFCKDMAEVFKLSKQHSTVLLIFEKC